MCVQWSFSTSISSVLRSQLPIDVILYFALMITLLNKQTFLLLTYKLVLSSFHILLDELS